jgi:hypothetical protein
VTVPPDSRSATAVTCEAAIQRLVACHESGERPGDDPGLAGHLGSCLGCFRAAADLKDVPRLAALLRQGHPLDSTGPAEAHDPGAAFWTALPAQLGGMFEQRRAQRAQIDAKVTAAPPGHRPVTAPAPADTAWQRFVRWVRLPVPAAMAGAACATAVALLMTRPPSLQQTLAPLPVTALDEDGAALDSGAVSLLSQDDVAFAQSPSVYESVEELDTGALARVRDSFGSAVDQALTPHGQLAADDDDPGMGATSTAPNPATFSDDLDQLDEQGLKALQAQLGGGK